MTRASRSESKRHALSSSSRRRPLSDSTQAFCHGDPGSMKSEAALLNRHQSLTAWATNSGPQVGSWDQSGFRRPCYGGPEQGLTAFMGTLFAPMHVKCDSARALTVSSTSWNALATRFANRSAKVRHHLTVGQVGWRLLETGGA